MREILSHNKESAQPKERDKNAEYHEKLRDLLKNIAQEMNSEFKGYLDSEKKGDLFEEDCSIRMNAFQKGEDGPYAKEGNIKKDKNFIKDEELEWSDAENEGVRKYYKDTHKAWDDNDAKEKQIEKTIMKWKELRKKGIGNLLEMAIMGIFYKIFKNSDFSIMRSAKYDDYKHGGDTIIVNKETGKVICAFDEIGDGERKDKQWEYNQNNAKRHGGELKYGVTFEKDEVGNRILVKKNIKDIPIFCLNLSKDELKKVLNNMEFDINKDPRETELVLFDKMVELMEDQTKILLDDICLNENIRQNLKAIPETLQKMKEAGAKYKIYRHHTLKPHQPPNPFCQGGDALSPRQKGD